MQICLVYSVLLTKLLSLLIFSSCWHDRSLRSIGFNFIVIELRQWNAVLIYPELQNKHSFVVQCIYTEQYINNEHYEESDIAF